MKARKKIDPKEKNSIIVAECVTFSSKGLRLESFLSTTELSKIKESKLRICIKMIF